MEIIVSEVRSGCHFYAQNKDCSSTLESIADKMKELAIDTDDSHQIRKGTKCAALYAADGLWYRAKCVEANRRSGTYVVRFVDYGNQASVSMDQLRPLDPASASVPDQAKEMSLAFLKCPDPSTDEGDEAAGFLFTWVKNNEVDLSAEILFQDANGCSACVLKDSSSNASVGVALLEAGLARVVNKRKNNPKLESKHKELLKALREAEGKAKRERRGLWVYGDADSDDESDRMFEKR